VNKRDKYNIDLASDFINGIIANDREFETIQNNVQNIANLKE